MEFSGNQFSTHDFLRRGGTLRQAESVQRERLLDSPKGVLFNWWGHLNYRAFSGRTRNLRWKHHRTARWADTI